MIDLIRKVSDHALASQPSHNDEEWDNDGESIAEEFSIWLEHNEVQPESPPEWFEAWDEYCSQYNEESFPDDDGQPDEAQE